MKSLKTLIRLNREELDAKRIELVKEQDMLENLENILIKIREDMVKEKTIASGSVQASYYFPNYIEGALEGEKKILELIEEQNKKIAIIRDEIAEKFSELKKFEILLEIKEKEAQQLLDKREQQRLDEIAINTFLEERKEDIK